MFKDDKGQTAIEVIIITAVVIIIVTVIGLYLKSKAVNITNEKSTDLQNVGDLIENKG